MLARVAVRPDRDPSLTGFERGDSPAVAVLEVRCRALGILSVLGRCGWLGPGTDVEDRGCPDRVKLDDKERPMHAVLITFTSSVSWRSCRSRSSATPRHPPESTSLVMKTWMADEAQRGGFHIFRDAASAERSPGGALCATVIGNTALAVAAERPPGRSAHLRPSFRSVVKTGCSASDLR